ncbi:MAG: tetratricopeptide repeat protein [Planctomycetaceae bacterium]
MSSTSQIDERLKRGQTSLRSGDPSGAAELFRQVVADNPDDAQAHEGLGTACFLIEDYDAAIAAFEAVTRLQPKQARARINLGAIYNRRGEYAAAIDALRSALQRDRKSGEAYYNMGLAHKGLDQLGLAVSAYREAVRLSPEMAEAHQNLANAYREMNNLRQAENHYRKALELRPDWEKAMRGLQHVQRELEQQQEELALGRLAAAVPDSAMAAEPRRLLGDEEREMIHAAAARSEAAARRLAKELNGNFEAALLSLAGVISRHSDQPLLVRDAHERFRRSLHQLVPLIQDLSTRTGQLRALVGDDGKP